MKDVSSQFKSRLFQDAVSSEKSSGTCLHPVHNAAPVASLNHGLRAGQLKIPIAICSLIQGDVGVCSVDHIVARLMGTGFARYIICSSPPANPNYGLWPMLQDALFKVEWTIGSENYVADCLQFSSSLDLIQWANETFVADGIYTTSVRVEAYWIEDNSLHTFAKLKGSNSCYDSIRKSARNSLIHTPAMNAWGDSPSRIAQYRAFLLAVWQQAYHYDFVGALEEVRRLFWLKPHRRHDQAYRVSCSREIPGNNEHRISSTIGGHPTTSGEGILMQRNGAVDRWSVWAVNFSDMENITWEHMDCQTRQNANAPKMSFLYTMRIQSADPTEVAILVRPCGQDTFWLDWIEPSEYEIQVCSDNAPGCSRFFRNYSFESNPEIWGNHTTFAPKAELTLSFYHIVIGGYAKRGRNNGFHDPVGIRVKKKNSPYVGCVTHQKIRDIHASLANLVSGKPKFASFLVS
jgi:hypothetical protein